eukprot:Amastigsp_a850832_12.p2 type:complete len:176 gc:universal Amastigsp_a850832_12:1026-499(-)
MGMHIHNRFPKNERCLLKDCALVLILCLVAPWALKRVDWPAAFDTVWMCGRDIFIDFEVSYVCASLGDQWQGCSAVRRRRNPLRAFTARTDACVVAPADPAAAGPPAGPPRSHPQHHVGACGRCAVEARASQRRRRSPSELRHRSRGATSFHVSMRDVARLVDPGHDPGLLIDEP